MSGRKAAGHALPLFRGCLDHLTTELPLHVVKFLCLGIRDSRIAVRIRDWDLQRLLEGRPLCQLVMPRLDVGISVDVDAAPLG